MYSWFKENPNNFLFKETIISGDLCVLITPKASYKDWTDTSKIYRSSIWRVSDGFPISLSFKKFNNFSDTSLPDFERVTTNEYSRPMVLTEKIDGSCLIVSKYKDEFIIRTRGSIDTSTLNNSSELPGLIEKYDIKEIFDTENISLIFEWVSPANRIVLKYDKPDLFLIGIVKHNDYSYVEQDILDKIAEDLNLKRPRTFNMEHLSSWTDLQKKVASWVSMEGIVLYLNKGQILKKIKSDWYYTLHHLCYNLKSPKKVLQFLLDNNILPLDKTFNVDRILKNCSEIISKEMLYGYDFAELILDDVKALLIQIQDKLLVQINESRERLQEMSTQDDPNEVIKLFQKYPELNKTITWKVYRKTEFSWSFICKQCLLTN